MAYYTALITAWNGATQPPSGVTGTGLTGGMTASQKIAAVNGWTVVGAIPTTFNTTGAALLNCINWTEFAALTAQQQSNLLMLCTSPGPLLGGSGNVGLIVAGMFLAYFSNHLGPTITALSALAAATVQPWWQANGYTSPFNTNDLTAAGGLT